MMGHRRMSVALAVIALAGLMVASTGGVAAQGGADLSVAISGPKHQRSTTTATYTITVRNAGPEAAANVVVLGSVGDQLEVESISCAGGTTGSSECTVPSLAADALLTATMSVSVCCFVKGEVRTTVVNGNVSAETTDPNLDNNGVQGLVKIIGGWNPR
jgi:uncharacterized repeat protein (TIGR01451 family)